MNPVRSVHVVAAVIVRDDRFLVCRRAAGKAAAGRWEFPGGKVEDGENSAAALRREAAEELGVAVRPGPVLVRSGTLVDGLLIDLECRWTTLEGEPPQSSTDHDVLTWSTRAELSAFDWCPPDLDAVDALVGGARPERS